MRPEHRLSLPTGPAYIEGAAAAAKAFGLDHVVVSVSEFEELRADRAEFAALAKREYRLVRLNHALRDLDDKRIQRIDALQDDNDHLSQQLITANAEIERLRDEVIRAETRAQELEEDNA